MARLWYVLVPLAVVPACEPKVVIGDPDDGPEDSSESGELITTGDADDADPYEEPEACDDKVPPGDIVPADDNDECDIFGEHRDCLRADGTPGTQFCNLPGTWGTCFESYECLPGETMVCFLCDPEFGTKWATCEMQAGIPRFDAYECDTPLVLRTGDRPVEFLASDIRFSLSAGDRCLATDWPTAATPWLARDLDRSGSIDGGHELFGSGTRLGPTYAAQGFAALAALDADGDARITPADAAWPELLLWFDHDGDRRSTAWELEPLAAHGLTELPLAHHTRTPRCDGRGNCELERATVVTRRGSAELVDIRLACQ